MRFRDHIIAKNGIFRGRAEGVLVLVDPAIPILSWDTKSLFKFLNLWYSSMAEQREYQKRIRSYAAGKTACPPKANSALWTSFLYTQHMLKLVVPCRKYKPIKGWWLTSKGMRCWNVINNEVTVHCEVCVELCRK